MITLVAGTALLTATLRVSPGSDAFLALGLGTAAVWVAGAFASGSIPIHAAGTPVARLVLGAALVALVAFVGFAVAYQVADHLPVLSGALRRILGKADATPKAVVLAVTLVNGLAEEVFFRGAVHAAAGRRRPVLVTLGTYVAVTAATGNVALVVAAVVMGTVFGLERRATGGVVAPVVTHLVWSTLMLVALPR